MIPQLLVAAACCTWADTDRPIRVDSVLITLVEQADVAARDVGLIDKVQVREGQMVRQGDVLLKLDDRDAALVLQRTRLEMEIAQRMAENSVKVRYAQKSFEVARAEWRRASEAGEKFKKSVSESELDQLRLVAERSELEIEQAKHELEIAKLTTGLKKNEVEAAALALERRTIRAPFDGTVVQIKRRNGESVQQNESLVRILRLDRLSAEGFVQSKDLLPGAAGSSVVLTVDLPGKPKATFPGKLVFVSPEVNPVSGQVRVLAEIDNSALLLRPGLTASLVIQPVAGGVSARPPE